MITKAIAILLIVIVGIVFAYVIVTKQPPKAQEYEEFGDYFFNQ